MEERTKRPLLASAHDRDLAEKAPLLLFSSRAMQEGRYRFPPGLAAGWQSAIQAGAAQLERDVLAAVARCAVDDAAATRPAIGRNLGGRPTRHDEIRAAFVGLPKASRMRLLAQSKRALYAELRRGIIVKTGQPYALGDHAMSEALNDWMTSPQTPETLET
jgi:hypothetical protein